MATNRDIATGVFRAWGVTWSIYVLLGLPQFLNAVLRHGYATSEKGMETYFVSAQALSIGCQVILALFLLRKGGWLAGIVFPVEREVGLAFSAQDFQAVLLAAIGVFFILDGVRHAFGGAYLLLTRPRGDSENSFGYLWNRAPEDLARALGGITGGTIVLFGRRGPRGLVSAIRAVYQRHFGLRDSRGE